MNAREWMERVPARPERGLGGAPPRGEADREEQQAERPEEEAHASRAFGGLWGRRDRAHTVEFRLLPGRGKVEGEALDYAWLPRIQWVPSLGRIVLVSTLGVKITICGINLWELKEKLRQHRVTWVAEQGNDPVFVQQENARARQEGREAVIVFEIRIEETARERTAAEEMEDA